MIAYSDPTLDAPSAQQLAEDAIGVWLSQPGRVVHIERPDGRVFLALAYEVGERMTPVAWGYGQSQVEALEELALRGAQSGAW